MFDAVKFAGKKINQGIFFYRGYECAERDSDPDNQPTLNLSTFINTYDIYNNTFCFFQTNI